MVPAGEREAPHLLLLALWEVLTVHALVEADFLILKLENKQKVCRLAFLSFKNKDHLLLNIRVLFQTSQRKA